MENTKTLREDLKEIDQELDTLKAEADKAPFSEEQIKRWDELEATKATKSAKLETLSRIERQASFTQPSKAHVQWAAESKEITRSDFLNAFSGWAKGHEETEDKISDKEKAALDKMDVDLKRDFIIPLDSMECGEHSTLVRAATTSVHTVGPFPNAPIENALKAYSTIRNVSSVDRTPTGGSKLYPTSNDVSNKGRLVGEGGSLTSTDVTFASVAIPVYKFSSDVMKWSWELDEDFNEGDFARYAAGRGTIRIARIENDYFTDEAVGTGTNTPRAFMKDATDSGVETTSFLYIDPTDIIELIYSVDAAYRANAVLMMNSTTMAMLVGMVDEVGRPLFTSNFGSGSYDTFLGYRIVINEAMPDYSAGNKAIAFGDFSRYQIRDQGSMFVKRLDELYAGDGLIGLCLWMRTGARLLDAGTHPIKYLTVGDGSGA